MVFKYDIEFDKDAVMKNINRITDRIFKLLPSREEGGDWETPLKNLILENQDDYAYVVNFFYSLQDKGFSNVIVVPSKGRQKK